MDIFVVFAIKDDMQRNLCAFKTEPEAIEYVRNLNSWKDLFKKQFNREFNPEDLATAEIQDWLDKNYINPDFQNYYEKLELQ